MVDVPEKIWIEQDECPYFYEESELSEVGSPVTEYIRADLCHRPEPTPCDELVTIGAAYLGKFFPRKNKAMWPDGAHELVTRQNAEEVIAAKDKEIAALQQLLEERRNTIASLIPRAPNCGRYLAECNDGQLMYLNHAGKWQECPNFITERDARIKELEKLCNDTEAEALVYASDKAALEDDNASLIHDLNRIKDHETKLINDNAAKVARIAELEADNKRLREALEVMLVPYEGSDCRRDHHGYCQEHFLEEDCCVAKARAAIEEEKP